MSRRYRFTKMHSCGNDFILFDCRAQSLWDPETMALILSDRHVGIGGDGMVMLCPPASDAADASLRFFDADGTELPLSVNGLRCAVKLAVDHALTDKTDLVLEAAGSRIHASFLPDTVSRGGKNADVRVDMGAPEITSLGAAAVLGGTDRVVNAVQIGGRCCVLFGEENKLTDPSGNDFDIDRFDLEGFAASCAGDPLLADNARLCVVRTLNKTTLAIRSIDGHGETRADAGSACAAVAAACRRGVCPRGTDVTVRLRGGEMTVRYEDDADGGHIRLTGPACTVFDGELLF